MKTQIITLESHDDLISVRDRMSWAKSPRILLVWPAYEQVPLRPLDLRILQQHATELGAQLGLVTYRGKMRRDAEGFGIPVFRSTAEAQRRSWSTVHGTRSRRSGQVRNRAAALRRMREQLHRGGPHLSSAPAMRIGLFTIGVLAVFSIASLFVPRATIVLSPITTEQSEVIAVEISSPAALGVVTGGVPAQTTQLVVSGRQTMRVQSRSDVPKERATGMARFQNVAQAPIVIPAGTVVYSVTPSAVRFATTLDARLEGRANAFTDVPIEALEPGAAGNVPAKSIQGIEGSLSASALVTNLEPTEGGLDAMEPVASQADREQLRGELLEELEGQAESKIATAIAEEDVILPDTLAMASVDQEIFEPPAGQPASVLSLAMSVAYSATYIRGTDLQRLAEVALDASMPQGYTAKTGTLEVHVAAEPISNGKTETQFSLEVRRTITRTIDVGAASQLIRGRTPMYALGELQSKLPLAAPAEIHLTPRWWPWLPLIPFRIDVVIA